MENLTDTRNEESVAELLSFISGVKVMEVLSILNLKLTLFSCWFHV